MAKVTIPEAQAHLSTYIEHAEREGPIVITRNGKAVAVIIAPLDDDDLESLLLARSPRFQALLERSRKDLKAGKVGNIKRDKQKSLKRFDFRDFCARTVLVPLSCVERG